MAIKLKTDKAIELYKSSGGTIGFEDSLRDVFDYASKDKRITNKKELAYLLATARKESGYSLQRWESDYLCGKQGVAYQDKPCQKALDYYRSTSGGKKNYYTLGTDDKGLPYFGRGLIQLTGKSNYDYYGKKIGVNLVKNADKALENKNSYDIAVEYLMEKRGGVYADGNRKRSTFDLVSDGNFSLARKSVRGSSSGWQEVKSIYDKWLNILNNPQVKVKESKNGGGLGKKIGIATIILLIIGGGIYAYQVYKKKNG
jgi:predicted chitinase